MDFRGSLCLNHCEIIIGLIKANLRHVVCKRGDFLMTTWQLSKIINSVNAKLSLCTWKKKKMPVAMSPWWHSETTEIARGGDGVCLNCTLAFMVSSAPSQTPTDSLERCCTCKGTLSVLQIEYVHEAVLWGPSNILSCWTPWRCSIRTTVLL